MVNKQQMSVSVPQTISIVLISACFNDPLMRGKQRGGAEMQLTLKTSF